MYLLPFARSLPGHIEATPTYVNLSVGPNLLLRALRLLLRGRRAEEEEGEAGHFVGDGSVRSGRRQELLAGSVSHTLHGVLVGSYGDLRKREADAGAPAADTRRHQIGWPLGSISLEKVHLDGDGPVRAGRQHEHLVGGVSHAVHASSSVATVTYGSGGLMPAHTHRYQIGRPLGRISPKFF